MGRIKKTKYIKSISVPADVNDFFKWLSQNGIERSFLIVTAIRKWRLYREFLKETNEKQQNKSN